MTVGYIAVIDYGAGNLMSVSNALDFLGCSNQIASKAEDLEKADGVILPGVGAFSDAMEALKSSGLFTPLIKAAREKPLLGICLGMQMLFEESEEGGRCEGLGLLRGKVRKIETDLKLPQIGWNSLQILRPNALTKNIKTGDYVYFVHSYQAEPAQESCLSAVCEYHAQVPAIVADNTVYGCQFHPEKSGEIGLSIIKAFTELVEGGGK